MNSITNTNGWSRTNQGAQFVFGRGAADHRKVHILSELSRPKPSRMAGQSSAIAMVRRGAQGASFDASWKRLLTSHRLHASDKS